MRKLSNSQTVVPAGARIPRGKFFAQVLKFQSYPSPSSVLQPREIRSNIKSAHSEKRLVSNGTEAVRTESLIRHYHLGHATIRAVDGVSLVVRKGEFSALLGASGSGKST